MIREKACKIKHGKISEVLYLLWPDINMFAN